MPEPLFSDLEQQLVKGGVEPRYVRRTIQELRDHYSDIERDLLEDGCAPEEAARRARTALGDERTLATAVLARPELRDWRCDWPRAAACLDSIVLLVVLPAVPVAYCAYRGPLIARWGASVSLAALVTGAFLLGLRSMFVL
jgi:hypothetical protein